MSIKAESRTKKKKQQFLCFSCFLFVWALAVVIMPVGSAIRNDYEGILIVSGCLFWLGVIGTAFSAFRINLSRKRSLCFKKAYPQLRQFGLTSFCKNKLAAIADITVIISIIGAVVAQMVFKNIYISFVFIALFVFSFGMHCMLNGINYIYITHKE